MSKSNNSKTLLQVYDEIVLSYSSILEQHEIALDQSANALQNTYEEFALFWQNVQQRLRTEGVLVQSHFVQSIWLSDWHVPLFF